MKFITVFTPAVLAIASANAAECTQDQLAAANSGDTLEKLQTACASSLSIASTPSADPINRAKEICADKPCMATIESMMNNQPDCTILGVNFKTKYMSEFTTIQSACKTLGVPVSKSDSGSTASTLAPSPTPSSSATTATLGVSVVVFTATALAQL